MPDAIPLPKSWFSRQWEAIYTFDLVAAIIGLPSAIIAADKAKADYGGGILWYILPTLLGLTLIRKWYLTHKKEIGKERIHSLEGALHTLHKILSEYSSSSKPHRLRLTLHRLSSNGDELIQAMDYIGDQRRKHTKGRRTAINCGIIGKAFGEKKLFHANRPNPDHELYIKELVDKWHYTEEAARNLDPSSRAWLAVPLLGSDNEVVAILYADSTEEKFFNDDCVLLAETATAGIAEFVSARLH